MPDTAPLTPDARDATDAGEAEAGRSSSAVPGVRPHRSGHVKLLWLIGPALVAGVAYVDPGNVASNTTAGARYGYLLIWVVLVGNALAWLIQYLSAKLGIVTGRSLPELLGERIRSRTGRVLYWLQAEIVAMATDLAEVIGGAIALNLLFGVNLLLGGLITGIISMGMLAVQRSNGGRAFEGMIVGLMLILVVGFGAGLIAGPPDVVQSAGGLIPRFEGTGSVLLATSILGATIMPHAIYAHSALTRDRFKDAVPSLTKRRLLWATKWDVSIAMGVAGAVNVVMLLVAAANLTDAKNADTLDGAYAALGGTLGPVIATLFAVGLLASGLASTSVGAYAGAEIMHGLLRMRVPMLLRRAVTIIPALAILALGFDPTTALVLSQVALSFGIPFALVPLVRVTALREVLHAYRNTAVTTVLGILACVLLVALNVALIALLLAPAFRR